MEPSRRLAIMRDQYNDHEVMLIAINEALLHLDMAQFAGNILTREIKPIPQNGIRIFNQLSERGRQKAEEYFDRLDENNNGCLTFEDFRGMLSITNTKGFEQSSFMDNQESWQMYMDELGISTNTNRQLSKQEFVKYRILKELESPLNIELDVLKLGVLPLHLQKWQKIKILITEIFASKRQTFKSKTLNLEQTSLIKKEEKIHIDEIPYILHNVNFHFNRKELYYMLLIRARFDKLMKHLLLKGLKGHYASASSQSDIDMLAKGVIVHSSTIYELTIDEFSVMSQSTCIAWINALHRSVDPSSHVYYQYALQLKYLLLRFIRRVEQTSLYLYDIGQYIKRRRIFKDFLNISEISSASKQISKTLTSMDISVLISQGAIQEGFRASWKLSILEDIGGYLETMKISPDYGSILYVDLAVRLEYQANTSTVNVSKWLQTCKNIHRVLSLTFERELKKNPEFKEIIVIPATDISTGARVIRIGIAYSKKVTFDAYLKQLGLPYLIQDIFTHIHGDIFCSVDLADILSSPTKSIDDLLAIKVQCHVDYRKDILTSVLQRIVTSFSCGYSEEQIKFRLKSMMDPFGDESKKQEALMSQFPQLANYLRQVMSWLQPWKTCSCTFQYKSISEIFAKLAFSIPWIRRYIPIEVLVTDGGLIPIYNEFMDSIKTFLSDQFQSLQTYLHEKIALDEQKLRQQALQGQKVEFEKRKDEVLHLLNRLGVEQNKQQDGDDSNSNNIYGQQIMKEPLVYLQQINDEMYTNDTTTFLAYQQIYELCSSISCIELISGKLKLNMIFDGLDIFQILPDPPNIANLIVEIDNIRKEKRLNSKPISTHAK